MLAISNVAYGLVKHATKWKRIGGHISSIESDCTAPLTLGCGSMDMIERRIDFQNKIYEE